MCDILPLKMQSALKMGYSGVTCQNNGIYTPFYVLYYPIRKQSLNSGAFL